MHSIWLGLHPSPGLPRECSPLQPALTPSPTHWEEEIQLLSGSLLEEHLGWEALTSSGSVPAVPLPSSWGLTICCF